MILESLRKEVLEANLELVRRGLVIETFGNASGIDRAQGLVAIKPSGIGYDRIGQEDLVILDLEGRIVEGDLRPSSDWPTHLVLYRAFPDAGGVVHTHSRYATAWAQAGLEIPCLGTTHADYIHGPIPITETLTEEEIRQDYEACTGEIIVRRFVSLDPHSVPAVLVHGHGPFCWGSQPLEAARNAWIVEELASLAYRTWTLNPAALPIAQTLLDKHFLRKHGPSAYYGQR